MFFNIIFNDIVPIFVVMALGYAGAKMNAFTPSQTQALNKVVLNFALPAALFVSITKATREMLFEDLTLTLVSLIGIVALFFVCYWVCRKVFHHTAAEAAVCGLTAGSPTIGFLGFAVLDPIYGATTQTGLVVAIVAIVANAVIIPIGMYLMSLAGAMGSGNGSSSGTGSAILNAVKQPVVWCPTLAVVIVLLGIKLPVAVYPSFDLIAHANSGVAVFAAGLALATVKFSVNTEILWNAIFRVFITPLCIAIAAILCGLSGEKLSMLTMACALPPAFSGIIIGSRYNVYVQDGASILAVSTLMFAFAAPFWIWFCPILQSWFKRLWGIEKERRNQILVALFFLTFQIN